MLIIFSDIHLGDGTFGTSISDAAFKLFNDRLRDLAVKASWRVNGKYQPIDEIHILMLGDILDILHSTSWLDKEIGEPGYARPWTDRNSPQFAEKIREITRGILANNANSIAILKKLTKRGLNIPRYSIRGKTSDNFILLKKIPVHLHYMIGNHDWYFHLPGVEFDDIRREITEAFGLDNLNTPFPHELEESFHLHSILRQYRVYARHGDIYDPLNFDKEMGRNFSSLGDALSMEIVNKFPQEIGTKLGKSLSPELLGKFRELVNIRPVLATSLWVSSLLHQFQINHNTQEKIKEIWNNIGDRFLSIPFVRSYNRKFRIDALDGIKMLIRISDKMSFTTLDDIALWLRKRFGLENRTFANHALKEKAFLDREADFIVYGHTHHHEIIPLDIYQNDTMMTNQMYINSGTWHPYFDLAVNKPKEQKFIPYQVMSYIAFFTDGEYGGKRFETWKGTFSK